MVCSFTPMNQIDNKSFNVSGDRSWTLTFILHNTALSIQILVSLNHQILNPTQNLCLLTFEHPGGCPQELLVGVGAQDSNQLLRSLRC